MNANFRKIKAIEYQNKQRVLKVNPYIDEYSGIYFLTREDENGLKYAYIGQAKHLLTRMAQHLAGHQQHIDKSLKKHGLYSNDNRYGWKIGFLHFNETLLDEKEQKYIKLYANEGYQLRNKTSGSQGVGKVQIDEYKPAKGYYDGIKHGKKTLARELSNIIDKHLKISLKEGKEHNKVSIKQFEKFKELLMEDTYND